MHYTNTKYSLRDNVLGTADEDNSLAHFQAQLGNIVWEDRKVLL